MFASIEAFLEHHKTVIMDAIGVTGIAVSSLGVYLSHGKRGSQLR
jgi:hypothetical protein